MRTKPSNSPPELKWLDNFDRYLETQKPEVLNARAREIMKQDASSPEAALKALQRIGLATRTGKLKLKFRRAV